jgi:hypothetical protein
MPDPLTVAAGISAVKTTFDLFRSAIGLVKDAKGLLPKEDKSVATITAALEAAESSSRIAEAEVAKALGYELCKCQFPPTPMLTVGMMEGRPKTGPVYECPKCGFNTAHPFNYERIAPERVPSPA